MITYSLVVPIYNDGYLAGSFCTEFEAVFRRYLGTKDIGAHVELIFVNDGSSNSSLENLRQVCAEFEFAKCIDLSRNFGQHIALAAGYAHATGQYVGSLNVDMEDPPDQIPIVLDHLKNGDYDIVLGVRKTRDSPPLVKATSMLFNWLMGKLARSNIPVRMATLRMMNRRFTDAYTSFTEKSPFLPGLEAWLGFKRGLVQVTHQRRSSGRSSYNFRRRLAIAVDALMSFSDLPLRLWMASGFLTALTGLIALLALASTTSGRSAFQAEWPLILVVAFVGGLQILAIGTAGLYISRIFREVQNRPLYVIREKLNFEKRL